MNGETVPVAQVGGGRLYFREARPVQAGPAVLTVEVDGEPTEYHITIVGETAPSQLATFK